MDQHGRNQCQATVDAHQMSKLTVVKLARLNITKHACKFDQIYKPDILVSDIKDGYFPAS